VSFKRKVFLVIAAVMIGISNAIFEEDKMVNDTYHQTEQLQEDETD